MDPRFHPSIYHGLICRLDQLTCMHQAIYGNHYVLTRKEEKEWWKLNPIYIHKQFLELKKNKFLIN